jgi:hypothetical protein
MQCARAPGDTGFSSYEVVKITYAEAGDCYFTMSANGVRHVMPDGTTTHFGLDQWAREEAIFKRLKKLMFFRQFPLWKIVRIWRHFVLRQHYDARVAIILTLSWH